MSPVKSLSVAIYAFLFFGGFGILCVIWAIATLLRGEYLTTVVVLGFAAFSFGLAVPFIILKSDKVTPRGAFDSAGTTIRPDRAVEVLSEVSAFGGVIAMAMFTILWPLGKLDIPIPHTMRYYIPFVSAAGAVMGAPALWRMVRRGGMSYIRLTPNGFKFSKGLPSYGEWTQVKDVADRVPGQPAPAYSAIVMVMADDQTLTLAAGSFTPEGQALRDLVRFYWQHPENRAELADGRALERLSKKRFDVD